MVLIFQPAEEGLRGAQKMIEEGALKNVEAIFGIHLTNRFPFGKAASRAGPILAGAGFFEAVITGKGGHAAIPQHTIDPVVAASSIVLSLQHLVSRETDPLDSKVSFFFFIFDLIHGLCSRGLIWVSAAGDHSV